MSYLRQFVLLLAFLLFFATTAHGTTITVAAVDIPNVQAGAGTYDLRIWVDRNFVDSLGVLHLAGAVDSPQIYTKVSCSLATTTVTCVSFPLASTVDAQTNATARYTAKLYRNNGPLQVYGQTFALPASLGSSVTWEQVWRYNNTVPNRVLDAEYYTKNQVNALYSGSIFSNPATTSSRGVVKLSVSEADPVVVVTTDPRVPTQSENDALVGSSGTPSSSNPYVTASDAQVNAFSANVKDSPYFASGSANTYTCSISSGTASLTCATSTDFLTGQGIQVPGAAAAGANLFTSIVTATGTALTVANNASTTVTNATAKHDDTDALVAAFAAVVNAGGGAAYVPYGFYRVNKPVNTTAGGVIYPPQKAWTGGLNQTSVPLDIVGEVAPSWGDYGVKGGGTIIQSDSVCSSCGVQYPAIFSAKAYSAVSAGNQHLNWNYVSVTLRNLLFRTYSNPSIGGANLMKAHRGAFYNVGADVGVTETTASSTAAANPTSEVIGLAGPQVENNGQSTFFNTFSTGYKYGYFYSDHTRFDGYALAARNLYGFWGDNVAGYATGSLYSYRNKQDLLFGGVANYVNFRVQIEADTASGTWTQRTIGTTKDFTDDSNVTHGVIEYFAESPGGTQDFALTTSGLGATLIKDFYNTSPVSRFSHTAVQTVTAGVGGAINVLFNTNVNTAAAFTHSTSSNTDQFVCTKTGAYTFSAAINYVTTGGGATDNGTGERVAQYTVNGTASGRTVNVRAVAGAPTTVSITQTLFVAKGDIVRLQTYTTNAGATLDVFGASPFGSNTNSPDLTIVEAR